MLPGPLSPFLRRREGSGVQGFLGAGFQGFAGELRDLSLWDWDLGFWGLGLRV